MHVSGRARRGEEEEGSQLGGYWPPRRDAIPTKDANDHVSAAAPVGVPGGVLRNCSASDPVGGV